MHILSQGYTAIMSCS